jgi:hypothetical protein
MRIFSDSIASYNFSISVGDLGICSGELGWWQHICPEQSVRLCTSVMGSSV